MIDMINKINIVWSEWSEFVYSNFICRWFILSLILGTLMDILSLLEEIPKNK